MYHLTKTSRNTKTGAIPVSTSPSETCPDACPFRKNGCYSDAGPLSMHWRKVSKGLSGTNWAGFCESIAGLPAGQLWRHNQAGDLPGVGDKIDTAALGQLVEANRGKRGYTYTHKPMNTCENREAVKRANLQGFTVSLSANTLAEADSLSELGIAPVVVILAQPGTTRTPEGRRVVQCPAQTRGVTCSTCGLCQRQQRAIVGFIPHGAGKAKVEAVARG